MDEISREPPNSRQMISKIYALLESYQQAYGPIRAPLSLQNLIKVSGKPIEAIRTGKGSRGRIEQAERGGWIITIPDHFSGPRKRVEIAHEFAHTFFLNPKEKSHRNRATEQSPEEEQLCELAARHLLMPNFLLRSLISPNRSIAMQLLPMSRKFEVTRHSIFSRMLDQDLQDYGVTAIVLWQVSLTATGLYHATPVWKSGSYYIPIRKCHVRSESLTYKAISSSQSKGELEDVSIGNLMGKFISEACGYYWDRSMKAFRQVFSVFRSPHVVDFNRLYKEVDPIFIPVKPVQS